ncbi:MAG: IS1380 family transposase [Lentisphaeria bacterium]
MQGSEEINSNGGFSFVKKQLDGNAHMKDWDAALPAAPNSCYSTSAIVRSAIGLMTAGNSSYADIQKFRSDFLFCRIVGGAAPSQETLRQRLDALAEEDWQDILDANVSDQLSRAQPTRIDVEGEKLIPLDIDVSVFEDTASHNEGVSATYRKVNGYAPIFCYAGREGFMVANELRPGSQHSENGAVEFLKRCIAIMLRAGYKANELLVRVDSGHDSSDFIKALEELEVKYLVKRNLRTESPEQLLDSIRFYETPEQVRPGKTIYRGVRSDKRPAKFPDHQGVVVVEAIERTVLADGQVLLIPSVELSSWWTNLPYSVRQCAALYREHGTSEQFHSELKSDMGIELLPSGNLKTNALVLGLATMAFNCLRFIGQAALEIALPPTDNEEKEPAQVRYRLRTVLLDFIKVGCKIVRHANQLFQKFGKNCYNFFIMKEIYAKC